MPLALLALALAAVDTPEDAIVITGERSKRSLRNTASSVEIYTAEQIRSQPGVDRLDQLLEQTPNIFLGTSSLGPTIRGQNTTGVLQDLPAFLGGNRQRVTLQVDGRAVSYNEFVYGAAPLWDVAKVEIFRSPQSTTQGRNSIAGAIFVETQDPTFSPTAKARAIFGDIAMTQYSAAVSAPLIGDQLAFRLTGDLRHGRPSSTISNSMVGADPNNDDYGLIRFKLLALPDGVPGLRVEASLVHSKSKMPQVEGVRAPFKQRRDPSATYGVFATRVDSLTVRAQAQLAAELSGTATLTLGDSLIHRFAPPGLGEALNKVRDWSGETVLTWKPEQAFELLVGAHHLRTRLDQSINLTAVLGNGLFDDVQQSTGLFGEATWRPTPTLRVTAGLRYQADRQDRTGAIGSPSLSLPLDYEKSFEAFLPKISLAIDLAPEITVGTLVQRAYNPGGATLNFDTGDPEVFDAEYAWSYELFGRASLGRLRLNGNLFRTNFRGAQRAQSRAYNVPGGGTAFWAEIENVPRSHSQGVELSVDWRVTERLRLSGGLGLLRTRITRTDDPANPIRGKEFQRSPHVTASAGLDWRPTERLQLTLNGRYHSRYFSTDTNAPALLVEGHVIANARASWQVGRVSLFGYARNLFDTFYMSHLSALNFGTAVDPRELGIGLEANF